jgi:transcriptional regulator with GAF, ATPase, and Fis domain
MDVTEQWNARAELEQAFEEIQCLKDRLQRKNIALCDKVDRTFMFEEIVGASKPLNTVLSRIAKVAPTDSTVLITGETGTPFIATPTRGGFIKRIYNSGH